MFRAPVVFLLSTILSIGPALFERLHIEEVNRALARIPVAKVATRSPLKRLPVRTPVHDPATCVICNLIHSPVAVQGWSMPALGIMDRAGSTNVESPLSFHLIRISSAQCRGPPAA